jgi:cytoskeletal protein CcmA (bactofilin family)
MAEKTTVIGERSKVSGNLEGDEDLLVKGRVEGTIRLTKTLHVEKNGIVVADVDVKDCVVSGVVVGDVTASDSVHITEGGRMVGDIKAPRVIIVAGAAFRGRVDMGDLDAESERRPARVRTEKPTLSRAEKAAAAGGDGASRPSPRPMALPRPASMAAPVAPRIATASGTKPPAPPAPPLPGGKRQIKKK